LKVVKDAIYKNQTKRVGLVQSGHHHYLIELVLAMT